MTDCLELCRYQYDPLDRLAALTPLAQAMARRFYQGESLATELQGTAQSSILRASEQLLAYKNQSAVALLGTDQQNSVLHAEDIAIAYAPYGHREKIDILPGLPGFNGEQPDPVTGHYLLGNGYRAYNPVLMRFNSSDSLSPFGSGGLNAYAYCVGDPVNRSDPTGHFGWLSTVAGLAGVSAVGTGIAAAATRRSAPETSKILAGVAGGLLLAALGFGAAAGFQKVGSKIAERFGAGFSGKGAIGLVPRNKASSFRSMQPVLGDMPPHIKEHIFRYLPGKDMAVLGQVSSDITSAVMATSKAQFVALKYADLPYQEWLGKLDEIYFGETHGVAAMLLKRNGIKFSDIRAEHIRPPRLLGYRFRIFPRTLKYGPAEQVDPRLLAMQLQAVAGGGFF
jgi:RHS repeat-associated protein